VAVYANSLGVGFVMDDEAIFEIGPKSLPEILLHGGARRLADITFALNYHLHGQSVAGYHLVNGVIHLATSLTLYHLSLSLVQAINQPVTEPGSNQSALEEFIPFFTALLFAVHPIQTQAVTYIIQRYTSLATFFYLLSALLFVKARAAAESGLSRRRAFILGGGAVTAGIFALFCKQISFTLPLMLLMIEVTVFRGRLLTRRFLVLCGLFASATLLFAYLNWHDSTLGDFVFDLRQGTSEDSHASRMSYFLTQFRVTATYLRLLVLPINQNLFYDYPLFTSLFSTPVTASLALHIALLTLAVYLLRQSGCSTDQQTATSLRLISLGIFWFYLALLIESSIFPIRDLMFEHRVYLPSAGIFLSIAAAVAAVAGKRERGAMAAWSLLAIVSLVLGGMTVARNNVWRDSLKFWEDTVRKAPNQYLAGFNLSLEYRDRNMLDKALPQLVRTLELRPNMNLFIRVVLGETLRDMRLYDESRFTTGGEYLLPNGTVSSYKSASVMYNNLGLAYQHLGDTAKAMTAYEKSVRIDSGYDRAWYNMGLLAISLGDRNRALAALQRLKVINPSLARSLAPAIPN